jgi:hypothetical protein
MYQPAAKILNGTYEVPGVNVPDNNLIGYLSKNNTTSRKTALKV